MRVQEVSMVGVSGNRNLRIIGTVVVVVALVLFVALPLTRTGDRPEGATRQKLTIISKLLQRWRQENGSYPMDIGQIDQLLAGDIPAASGARLRHDSWGRPFTYRFPSSKPSCEYDLYSHGPNGRDDHGNEDDIIVDIEVRRPGCD